MIFSPYLNESKLWKQLTTHPYQPSLQRESTKQYNHEANTETSIAVLKANMQFKQNRITHPENEEVKTWLLCAKPQSKLRPCGVIRGEANANNRCQKLAPLTKQRQKSGVHAQTYLKERLSSFMFVRLLKDPAKVLGNGGFFWSE